jgi:hypothetical protein
VAAWLLVAVAAVGSLLSAPAPASDRYGFTPIAESSETFQPPYLSYCAAMNEAGAVSLLAWVPIEAGEELRAGVFRGDGGPLETILAPTATRSADDSTDTAIDEDGSVVFAASIDGVQGLYRSTGGVPGPPLVEESGGIIRFRSPAITDAGVVAVAEYGPPAPDLQLVRIDAGEPLVLVDFTSLHTVPSVAASGSGFVAVATEYFSSRAILRTTVAGGMPVPFASPEFPVDVNEAGRVASIGCVEPNCSRAIQTSTGVGDPISIADTSGPFEYFGTLDLDNHDGVTFWAMLDGFELQGIYTGPGEARDRVIRTGDALFGSTVETLQLIGANDSGQIAFSARLEDARSVIARAEPLPAAGAAVGQATALLGLAGVARCRGRVRRRDAR